MTPARAIPTRNSSTLMPISGKDYRVARWALNCRAKKKGRVRIRYYGPKQPWEGRRDGRKDIACCCTPSHPTSLFGVRVMGG
ncbi:hypothetical protein CEXT_744221 [Caerostris extrusa]|uniref:Uncharacterized protein n=1 Tax=Caerostris extrusa TaxID=172846 RepID=A0AAV4Q9Z7_CAEEX|nr:hypothetical protein CEXT_744221 [Caerostris extrusa]